MTLPLMLLFPLKHFDLETDEFNDTGDNSDVESEGGWLDEPQIRVMELAQRPFKMLEAVAFEVHL